MLQVLINFVTFHALNTPPEVYVGLAIAWLLLLIAGFASVINRSSSMVAKVLWLLVIVGLPIIGLLVYCFWCVVSADFAFLKMFGLHRQTAVQLRSAPSRSKG